MNLMFSRHCHCCLRRTHYEYALTESQILRSLRRHQKKKNQFWVDSKKSNFYLIEFVSKATVFRCWCCAHRRTNRTGVVLRMFCVLTSGVCALRVVESCSKKIKYHLRKVNLFQRFHTCSHVFLWFFVETISHVSNIIEFSI